MKDKPHSLHLHTGKTNHILPREFFWVDLTQHFHQELRNMTLRGHWGRKSSAEAQEFLPPLPGRVDKDSWTSKCATPSSVPSAQGWVPGSPEGGRGIWRTVIRKGDALSRAGSAHTLRGKGGSSASEESWAPSAEAKEQLTGSPQAPAVCWAPGQEAPRPRLWC